MNKFLFYNYLPKLTDHVLDHKYTDRIVHHNYPEFIIDNIKNNDTIFVKTDLLPLFFNKIYPLIHNKFYLITGCSDIGVDNNYISFLNNDKIIRWIGCNILIKHNKIFKIPIGFEENELPGGDQILLDKLYNNKLPYDKKINKLLITQFRNTHESRNKLESIFNENKYCVCLKERLPFNFFMDKLNQYKFILSPRGNGVDTHRFWEILLVGSIPIVETSGLNDLYNKFPCIIVNSFEDINENILNSYQHDTEKEENIKKYLLIDNFNDIIREKYRY